MSPSHSFLGGGEAARLGGARDKWSFACKPALELVREPQPGTEAPLPPQCEAEPGSPCPALARAVSPCLATRSLVPQPRRMSSPWAALRLGVVGPCSPCAHHPRPKCPPASSASRTEERLRWAWDTAAPAPGKDATRSLTAGLSPPAAGAGPEVGWPPGSMAGERWRERLSSAVGDAL